MKTRTLEALVSYLETNKKDAEKNLADFAAAAAINPIYALENADGHFNKAGVLFVCSKYLRNVEMIKPDALSDERVVDMVIELIEQDMVWAASNIRNNSTSATTNLMDASKLQASTKLYRWLKNI